MYYQCHKINPNQGGSYIDSPDWIKYKKPITNLTNKKDKKCFHYAVTVVVNDKDFWKNNKSPNLKNKYKWQKITFPSEKYRWKKFQKNNVTIALNVLYGKKQKIHPGYVSKFNSNHEEKFLVSMISNG